MAGTERFAFGFQCQGNSDWTDSLWAGQTSYLNTVVNNSLLTTAFLACFPTSTSFTNLDAYLYTGGSGAAKTYHGLITGKAGTNASLTLPPQLAVVVSLRTGRPGRSYRGRSYLPAPAANQLSAIGGQLGSGTVDALSLAFHDMLASLGTVPDPYIPLPPVVASAKTSAMSLITAITVDSVLDTQRDRRNKLVAAYTKARTVP